MDGRINRFPLEDELVRVHCPICKKLVCKVRPVPGMAVETKCKEGHIVQYTVPFPKGRDRLKIESR